MATTQPLFSVVTPTYNYGHFLAGALESVAAQPGGDFEIVVVDDGSTDDTAAVVAGFREAHGAAVPLTYLYQENRGHGAARNAGARLAKGRYTLFLDADDRLLPAAFELFRAAIARYGELDMIHGGRAMVTPDVARRVYRPLPLSGDRQRNFADYVRRRRPTIGPGAAIVRRRVLERLRFQENIRVSEDLVFYAQVLALFDCAAFADPVIEFNLHGNSTIDYARRQVPDKLASVDLLFDPAVLPAELMRWRDDYRTTVYLSLFRALHRNGADAEARGFYRRALRLRPGRALRPTYVRKVLRGLVGRHPLASGVGRADR